MQVKDFLWQIFLFLFGLVIELGVPLFLSEENQNRFVRVLGAMCLISAILWTGFELGQKQGVSATTSGQKPAFSSTPIVPGTSRNGTIATGEVNSYSLMVEENATVHIKVEAFGLCFLTLEVAYSDGRVIIEENTYSTTPSLDFTPEPGVEYIIRVKGSPGSRGTYTISVVAQE